MFSTKFLFYICDYYSNFAVNWIKSVYKSVILYRKYIGLSWK